MRVINWLLENHLQTSECIIVMGGDFLRDFENENGFHWALNQSNQGVL
jgi:hypothetical protein